MICKQGDLAYIKKAIRPENIGRIVTCKEMLGYFIKGETYTYNGEVWMAADTDYMWVVTSNSGVETMYGTAKEVFCPDSWLKPIRGDLTPDEVTNKDLELTS